MSVGESARSSSVSCARHPPLLEEERALLRGGHRELVQVHLRAVEHGVAELGHVAEVGVADRRRAGAERREHLSSACCRAARCSPTPGSRPRSRRSVRPGARVVGPSGARCRCRSSSVHLRNLAGRRGVGGRHLSDDLFGDRVEDGSDNCARVPGVRWTQRAANHRAPAIAGRAVAGGSHCGSSALDVLGGARDRSSASGVRRGNSP